MWASLARVRFHPSRVDDAIDLTRAHLVPAFVAQPGARHGYWMVDRTTGHCVVVTCWDSREAIEEARADLGAVRTMVIDELSAVLMETGIYAVHGLASTGAPIPGRSAWSRISFVEGLSPDVDDPDNALFGTARRRYEGREGFLSLCWLVDAASGNGLGIVTWETEAACRASEDASHATRRQVEQVFRCRIDGVEVVQTIAVALSDGELPLDPVRQLAGAAPTSRPRPVHPGPPPT